eukprot:4561004-Amphidinium_carterae.3
MILLETKSEGLLQAQAFQRAAEGSLLKFALRFLACIGVLYGYSIMIMHSKHSEAVMLSLTMEQFMKLTQACPARWRESFILRDFITMCSNMRLRPSLGEC